MANRASRRLANELLCWSGYRNAAHFRRQLLAPAACQAAVLRRILSANVNSRYGQAHGFATLNDPVAYRNQVPIVDYDALVPWIERIKHGEAGVLTTAPVLMFEKSSGSTASSKYIPYTAALRSEFQAATGVWLYDLYSQRPALRRAGAYWSVSPAARAAEVTAGGLQVGFDDDTAYFGALTRWVLRQLLLLPPAVRHVPDMDTNRYVTLRFLLDGAGPGLVSIWNPSFLTLLVRQATVEGDRLVADLAAGTLTPPRPLAPAIQALLSQGLRPNSARSRALKTALARTGEALGTALFPHLQLISCWTDGAAARFLPDLQALFAGVEIQGKGLLATEGVVSFPLIGRPGAVLALTSHYYEFVRDGDAGGPALGAHEVVAGARYTVLLTTGGGLYRYALHDLIEVVGFAGLTPLVTFVGKSRQISDVVGEKLNELHVAASLAIFLAEAGAEGAFAMLAPEWGEPPGYVLYLAWGGGQDDALARCTASLEQRLRDNHHYAYARDLGQLAPVVCRRIANDAEARYMQGCEALGQRAGEIKPTALHRAFGWQSRFTPIPPP